MLLSLSPEGAFRQWARSVLDRESNLSSKSLESLSFRGRRSHHSLLCQERQQERKTDGGGKRKDEEEEKKRIEWGRAANTFLPWASGTNYTREGMSVVLCCFNAQTNCLKSSMQGQCLLMICHMRASTKRNTCSNLILWLKQTTHNDSHSQIDSVCVIE